MSTYLVADSRELPDERYPDVTDALRAAMADPGVDVFLHAESCTADIHKLGGDCPCRPVLIQRRSRRS